MYIVEIDFEIRSAMRGGIAWRFDFESRVMVEGITLTMGDLLSKLVNRRLISTVPLNWPIS